MTREEAINTWVIPAIKNTCNEKKCKEILKALEQEPVLDKIRTEIEQKIVRRSGLNHTRSERDRNDAFLEVLDVIDKYRK